uniref:Phosphatidylinositol-specific phospholipase C X domain-containing protein n=1 Tax=Lates calcarifer TaxID=8187 RepID=A0A4W6CUN4_LATCA
MSPEKGKGRAQFTSYRDWMAQLPVELHNTPLFNLAIPGSHDSMSYDLDINSSIIEPDKLKKLSKIYCARKIVRKWAVTQEETITKQLDAGVRYLDLRIARKANDTDPTRLYFYHGLYTRTDVETVLKEINDWAEKHPKEIVILALSNFKGFDKNIKEQLHNHLINFIKTLFGAKLFLRMNIPTLKRCWDQGRNVIVSYDYPANQHPEIWGKIKYYYGKSMDPTPRPNPCELTLFHHLTGLNVILKYILRLCDRFTNVVLRSLPKLLNWVKQQACKTPMNIVASDVVTRDNFIPTIVQLNISK